MARDAQLILSDAQEETTVAAHDSDNVVDLGIGTDAFGNSLSVDPNRSGQLFANFTVETALTSGGSATLAVKLQDSADNVTFADVEDGVLIAATAYGTFTAGYRIKKPLPTNLARYVKAVYTIGTAVLTAGAWSLSIDHGSEFIT